MGWRSANLEMSPAWGSNVPNHRLLLRQRLAELCRDWPSANPNDLSDLSRTPKVPGIAISVSHCPDQGGFILVKNPFLSVGFDIEMQRRFSPPLEGRVSSPAEVAAAPFMGALWVAKEATFKALMGPLQPGLVSEIEIHSWIQERPVIWRFSAKIQHHGNTKIGGIVWLENRLIMGLAEKIPQLWSGDSR